MRDVRAAIEELRAALQSVRDEGELLRRIESGVAELREAYRRDASAFTADDVLYLRGLGPIAKAVRSFVEEKRQRELEARIAELEQTPRRCRRGHKMEIREGPRGRFWGCGAYPFCHHVALLTKAEWQYLNGSGGGLPAGLAKARQLTLV